MNASLKKIGWILLLVILLPALAYSVYEISSMNRNETEIAKIYDRQLETFLFSINQHSDYVVGSWVGSAGEASRAEAPVAALQAFLTSNVALSQVVVFDSTGKLLLDVAQDSARPAGAETRPADLFGRQRDRFDQLGTYARAGYRKIEGVEDPAFPDQVLLLFVMSEPNTPVQFGAFVMEPVLFIKQVLAARMQVISDEKFIIAAIRARDNFRVYATDSLGNRALEQQAPFWLIAGYELGITPAETTLGELIRSRTYMNLGLLLGLNLLLIAGTWWVFRNIRREVALAQLKSDFVSNVSHEIRTPLALISMFAETLHLDRVPSEEKRRQYYSILNQEALRLTGIVNKILNFSQIEAGNRVYKPVATDLNEIVENVLPSFDFHLRQQGFVLQFFPDENLPLIEADAEALAEALINLLDNAIKYSPVEKAIEIQTGTEGGYAYLAVSDKGMGIPEDKQKMIFDKFFRVAQGDVHNTQGAGLGLALVRHIVNAHGGTIHLESKPGSGSRFQLNFPLNTSRT